MHLRSSNIKMVHGGLHARSLSLSISLFCSLFCFLSLSLSLSLSFSHTNTRTHTHTHTLSLPLFSLPLSCSFYFSSSLSLFLYSSGLHPLQMPEPEYRQSAHTSTGIPRLYEIATPLGLYRRPIPRVPGGSGVFLQGRYTCTGVAVSWHALSSPNLLLAE